MNRWPQLTLTDRAPPADSATSTAASAQVLRMPERRVCLGCRSFRCSTPKVCAASIALVSWQPCSRCRGIGALPLNDPSGSWLECEPCDGLGLLSNEGGGMTELRLLRLSRGWDPVQLIGRMKILAERDGVTLPHVYQLVWLVFLWENARITIPGYYAGLLRRIYGEHTITPALMQATA